MNAFEKGLLRYLTKAQLRRIQSKKIGIGGAGGLGSNAALALLRSGFKQFEILDEDLVEPSNLNRQQYVLRDIGRPKVSRLKHLLLSINPDAKIRIHERKWTRESAGFFFRHCDFIIEAFDKAEWKCAFVDYYQDKAGAVISGNGMAGWDVKIPLKIKKMGNVYLAGDFKRAVSTQHPPMAPRVMCCAAMMAAIVLDLALRGTRATPGLGARRDFHDPGKYRNHQHKQQIKRTKNKGRGMRGQIISHGLKKGTRVFQKT